MMAPFTCELFGGPLDGETKHAAAGWSIPPGVLDLPAPPRLLSPHVDPRHPAAAALAPVEVVRYRLTWWSSALRTARYKHEPAT